jgi:putative transport protein
VLAIMALVIEVVAILLSIVLGRFILKLNWGLLSGAICGGCTSAVGLGTALNTMDSDEPTLGYGAAQPFAILANVLLISMFHTLFFI